MKQITDSQLSAYVDNELSPEESAEIERLLSESDELSRRYQAMKAADLAVKQYYADADNSTADRRMADMISDFDLPDKQDAKVVTLVPRQVWSLAAGFLLFGLLLMQMSPTDIQEYPLSNQQLAVVASSELSGTVLDIKGGRLEVVQSWFNSERSLCRELVFHNQLNSQSMTGCYQNGKWKWTTSLETSGQYQVATETGVLQSETLTPQEELEALRNLDK